MTESDKRELVMKYVAVVGEQALKDSVLRRLQEELGLSHEEILAMGKEIALASLQEKVPH